MKTKWVGVALVITVAFGIVVYKQLIARTTTGQSARGVSSTKAEIILVADFREAGTNDNCAEIIRLVRAAAARGVAVQELSPDSEYPLLKRYRVLTVPTLLVLDLDGNVVSRYEGEEGSTVQQIRDRLTRLSEAKR